MLALKVLFGGDTHGSTAHVDYYLRTANRLECDYVFVVGDFGYWEHSEDGKRFLTKVDRIARSHALQVGFLDGNHDNLALLESTYQERDDDGLIVIREHVRYAPRGHRWTWGNTRVLAAGGAASLDKEWRLDLERAKALQDRRRAARHRGSQPRPLRDFAGTLWFPGEELTDEETDRIIAAGGVVDLMLTHDKPRESKPSFNRKDEPAAWPNQDRLQRIVEACRPQMLIHGHLHFRYTDTLSTGTVVEGLSCDVDAGMGLPGYTKPGSWLIATL